MYSGAVLVVKAVGHCTTVEAGVSQPQIRLRRRVVAVRLMALSEEQGGSHLRRLVDVDAFTTFCEDIWGVRVKLILRMM